MSRAALHGCVALVALALALAGCGGGGGGSTSAPSRTPSALSSAAPSLVARAKLQRCPRVEPAPPGTKGPSLPAVTLPCLGAGPDVPLSGLRGPLVLNLWATWCDPCRAEAPLFQRLHASARDRVRVLGVDSEDRSPDAALSFAIDRRLSYPSVYDQGGRTMAGIKGGKGLPITLFVDRAGRIAHRKIGPYTSYHQLDADVRTQLGVRP